MAYWQQLKKLFSAKPKPAMAQSFSLTVQKITHISEHVRRITLGGSAVRHLPQLRPGSCIRLLFESDGRPLQRKALQEEALLERPFTVRFCDTDMLLVTIDVMLGGHLPDGPARQWASKTRIGEDIQVKGPWVSPALKASTDWVLLGGEVPAIPAIAHHLEALHPATRGIVAINNSGMSENILLSKPVNMEIVWNNGRFATLPQLLQNIPRPAGSPAAWIGARQQDIAPLSQWLEQSVGVPEEALSITAYDSQTTRQVFQAAS